MSLKNWIRDHVVAEDPKPEPGNPNQPVHVEVKDGEK